MMKYYKIKQQQQQPQQHRPASSTHTNECEAPVMDVPCLDVVSTQEPFTFEAEQVPDYVPNYCDMVIFKPDCLEFLDQKEATEFKRCLMAICPCQQGKGKCPVAFTNSFDIHCWFDNHIRALGGWIHPVKYICNCDRFVFRHYHDSHRFRIISDRNRF